jgi:hypothetical protein
MEEIIMAVRRSFLRMVGYGREDLVAGLFTPPTGVEDMG